MSNDRLSVFVEDPTNPGKANRLSLLDPLTRSAMTIQVGHGATELQSASLGSTNEVQFDAFGVPYNANGVELTTDGTIGITGGLVVRITATTGLVTIE